MSTTENNRRRIARMNSWIGHAEKASGEGEAHIRFLFYWIAYEAAYQTYETEKPDGGDWTKRQELHRKLASHDRGRLQGILRGKKDDIVRLFELRQAHPSFWKKWWNAGVTNHAEWEAVFRKKVGSATGRLNVAITTNMAGSRHRVREVVSDTLDDMFDSLNLVRQQIVHGASAGRESHGRTQVILGAGLLSAFIPCFRDSIAFNRDKEWGAPPFPRVGSGPDDKCPPPWLSRRAKTPLAALGRRPGALKRFLDERNE